MRCRFATSITDTVVEPGSFGSPTCAESSRRRPGSKASPFGFRPTPTLSTRPSSVTEKMPTVSSPRFEVNTSPLASSTSAPATAVNPPIVPMCFRVGMSITSMASFAVCATYTRPVAWETAAWSKPPLPTCGGRSTYPRCSSAMSASRHPGDEPLHLVDDLLPRGVVAIANVRHVPTLDRLAARRGDVAAERHHARRRAQVVQRDRPRTLRRRLEPIGREPLHREGAQFRVGLGAGRRRLDRETPQRRQLAEVRGGHDALRGTVQADEQHPRRRRRGRHLLLAVGVEGVVHRELARHVVEVVPARRLEPGGGGVETGRLGGEAAIVGVGAAHDHRQRAQRGVRELVAIDKRVERAFGTVMTEVDVGDVVRDRAAPLRLRGDLLRRHEDELRPGVDEARDQPRARDAIDTGTFTGDPFHGRCSPRESGQKPMAVTRRRRTMPSTTPPATILSGAIRHSSSAVTAPTKMTAENGSATACGASRTSVTPSTPMMPATIPCNAAFAQPRARTRSNTGSSANINTNDGAKMAIAATTAPVSPSAL